VVCRLLLALPPPSGADLDPHQLNLHHLDSCHLDPSHLLLVLRKSAHKLWRCPDAGSRVTSPIVSRWLWARTLSPNA
jgi:hypothetical protein